VHGAARRKATTGDGEFEPGGGGGGGAAGRARGVTGRALRQRLRHGPRRAPGYPSPRLESSP